MRAFVGTSGFQYRAWRGDFYPERCREADMLGHYATRLRAVEVNNTFYRMPRAEVLTRWRETVPDGFRFAIKASQRITHRRRLRECEEPVGYLLTALEALGPALGPVLFQLPPNMRRDDARLSDFLAQLPSTLRVAFEFRHTSWRDDAVLSLLQRHGAALCIADVDGTELPGGLVSTASHGYLRLRREDYDEAALDRIGGLVADAGWTEVYAFFKHEARGPWLAGAFAARLSDPAA